MAETFGLVWRQYRLERRMFWRNPSAAFFNFVLPLILLFLLGAVYNGSQENLDIVVPGIAGLSVMTTTFNALAMSLTFLREQGVLKRVRGTPLPSGAYLGGLLASAVTNAAAQVVIVVACGKAFFGVDWPPEPAMLVLFGVVGVVTFAALGVAFSHVIPNFDSAPAYVNIVFLPVMFISGVFYDENEGPDLMRDVAEALPLTHLVDGLSAAMVTGDAFGDVAGDLAFVALWGAFALFFAVRGFRWESRRD